MRCPTALLTLLLATTAAAQPAPLHDADLSWRTYASQRTARVRVFASGDEERPRTVVLDGRATNGGVLTDEARYLAELVGRELGFDPVEAVFVFRFTPAAFVEGAPDGGKTLLLRATFRRVASGGLGSPSWRVISADALAELTDRGLR